MPCAMGIIFMLLLRGLQVQNLPPAAVYLMELPAGIANWDGFPICQVGNRGDWRNKNGKDGNVFYTSFSDLLFFF